MNNILQMVEYIYELKSIVRTGWKRSGIINAESVADHSFGVSMLVFLLPTPQNVNKDKAIKLALCHDFVEAIIGDIVWETNGQVDESVKKMKVGLEEGAIQYIEEQLKFMEFSELANEYMEQETEEAKYVKELDKLDMGLQAKWYMRKGYNNLREFITSSQSKISTPMLKHVLDEF